jgi:murein DD-endopeptidase MepM/ murein hydrolase activator NlpD
VTRYLRTALSVVAPAPPPPTAAPASLATTGSKVFPVQGPYSFGGEGARFGAGRTGHIHQGQDIVAAEGIPVVAPVGGVVHWVAYQASGAGHYVVVAGADGRHYVFMHLQTGSIAVAKGAPVTAGQRLGAVGNTGASEGAHLHFEIWVNGWWATKASAPIDPLPELQAWAAA